MAPSPELEEAPLSAGAGQVREDRAEAAFVLLSPGSSFPLLFGQLSRAQQLPWIIFLPSLP